MKTTFRRSLSLVTLGSFIAAVAQAHPGHDGHDHGGLTWDFGHLAAHPFATLGCVALLVALGWAAWSHLRTDRVGAPQSLRKSDEQ
jgi:hydrogenase/urease accessory protein HupE